MPAKRSPGKPEKRATTAAPDADPAADPSSTDAAAVAEDPPLNRAERRARGKGQAQPPQTGRGKVAGGHGPAHTQRMWANRRSGS